MSFFTYISCMTLLDICLWCFKLLINELYDIVRPYGINFDFLLSHWFDACITGLVDWMLRFDDCEF